MGQYKRVCEWCGETFIGTRPTQRFCGKSCAAMFTNENREYITNEQRIKRAQERPFTNNTEYLIKLWYSQGDTPEMIADILNRPLETICAVLGVEVPERKQEEKSSHKTGRKCYPVECIETGEIFPSALEAAKKNGGNKSAICSMCNGSGRIKSVGGYTYRYYFGGEET